MSISTWLTVNQIAAMLQTKPERVRHAIHRGELAAISIATDTLGRAAYRINPKVLERWIASRSTAKPQKTTASRRRSKTEKVDFYR